MERKSLWEESSFIREREPLRKKLLVNTAIIGGGMAGILTACLLQEKGISCVVLEADRIGSGQTGHTTAKVTSQHNLIYDKLIQSRGREIAEQYAGANQMAIENYRRLVVSRKIDCDWTEAPAYLYTRQNPAVLVKECEAAKMLGIGAEMVEAADRTELPFPAAGALMFAGQAHFHPLKFLGRIAEEVKVYEHSRALHVGEHEIKTEHGMVSAENIVFATHYPFVNVPGYYFLKMHQERSYVLALEKTGKKQEELRGMYLGIDESGLSLRSWNGYILLGGEGHRTGENTEGGQYQRLERAAAKYFPEYRIAAKWSAQDCMTLDQVPYIGRYGHTRKNWYVATGFGKWGMTSSMVSAMLLSDMIAGKENPNAEAFSPQRSVVGKSMKNVLNETGHAVRGLVGSPADLSQKPAERSRDGEEVRKPAERSHDGEVVRKPLRCTHLGCQLTWNQEEGTYDCPCHGSRFDENGRLIDGPAQTDLP